MPNFELARRNMIHNQIRPNKVTDPRVLDAMGAVPREIFVDEAHQGIAYVDEDIPLGEGRFLMEPMVLARLLQEADIRADDVVLDIGCGSGYTAAVCARLAATVVAVESDARLAAEAGRVLDSLGADNVVVVEGALAEGYPEQAPYDVIILSGAMPEIPRPIESQLADGGRLVGVIDEGGRSRAVLARNVGGVVSQRAIFDASVPMLPGCAREKGFVF